MKTLIQNVLATLLLSLVVSCSCAIDQREWISKPNSKQISESAIRAASKENGFRETKDGFKKRSMLLSFDSDRKSLRIGNSWCPTPEKLLFLKKSYSAWVRRSAGHADSLLDWFKYRGYELSNSDGTAIE